MRRVKTIDVTSAHAEGEVGDVITGGVVPPPGETLWAQSRWIATDGTLRNFLLNEPRGGVFRHVNLLVPPINPQADMGFIIMEPEDTPPMSGSNTICVATVLLERGILPMQEPVTTLTLEAPGGLVHVRADCRDGKVLRVHLRNLPSFVVQQSVSLSVPELGEITVDTGFGGDSFVIVDADNLNLYLRKHEARRMAKLGARITDAANAQLGFVHPGFPEWQHFSFCLFAGSLQRKGNDLTARMAVAIQPGKIDRSPTGTAISARMALMHARGEMTEDDRFTGISIIDSQFQGRITGFAQLGDTPAILPEISGRAWITGTHQHTLDADDPWPDGYRLSDTWPDLKPR